MVLIQKSLVELVSQARNLAQMGQLEPARAAYRQAITIDARNYELLQEVAYLEIEAGNYSRAAEWLVEAIEIQPESPDARMNLGEAYRLAGASTHALHQFAKAVDLSPEDGDARHALADMLVATGQWEQADDHASAAVKMLPNDPEPLNLYGIILERNGDVETARSMFKKAINIDSGFADAISNYAALNFQQKNYREAVILYRKLEKIVPLSDEQYQNLYNSYLHLDNAKEALSISEKLLISPSSNAVRNGFAYNLRGMAYRSLGKFEDAERDFRHLLKTDSRAPSAYENLGSIHRLNEEDIRKIQQRLSQPELQSDEKISLWYALFAGHSSMRDFDSAFEALTNANQLMTAQKPFDPVQMRESARAHRETFSQAYLSSMNGQGYKRPGPIFIIGMPRSGTTLTERILAAHSKVHGGGEQRTLPSLTARLENFPTCVVSKSKSWFYDTGKTIHQSTMSDSDGKRFVTDKLPGNYLNVGFISLVLPNARFIYCKRNPIDNCLSCLEQHFEEALNYSYSQEGVAQAYREHEIMMDHWFQVCPDRIHTVLYEELVNDPEPQVREMLEFLDLDWQPACLTPEQTDRAIVTASVWQARQPINNASVERWRRYEKHLQPLIEALGTQ